MTSLRVLFALTTKSGLEIHQMDVETMLNLNGYLDEEIYMHQPEA